MGRITPTFPPWPSWRSGRSAPATCQVAIKCTGRGGLFALLSFFDGRVRIALRERERRSTVGASRYWQTGGSWSAPRRRQPAPGRLRSGPNGTLQSFYPHREPVVL